MGNDVVRYQRKIYAPLGEEITVAALVAYARQHCKEGIDYLVGVMNDEKESTKHRLRATQLLLDRGLGRPAQSIEVSGDVNVHVGSGMRGLRESMIAERERRLAMGPIIDEPAIYDEEEGHG